MFSNQDTYLQRNYQAGWHDLVYLFFNEFTNSQQDKDPDTLRRIGGMLAQWYPIDPSNTVNELEQHINHVLELFNWGFVKMAPAQRELILIHCAWPHAPESRDEAQWRRASAYVLEGAYSQWLVSQGAGNSVPVRWKENTTEDVLIFRYAMTE
ncbi:MULTISPECIES: cellulose biosynthesis protein BcsD [Mangrovibacter]|uniref:Cellulose synthase n=2 Tax=Mangrovibacter TaxID=451512 RepID=A0A1B7L3S7_9ENTR|nr:MULTISPECIES: cellulose biosynthesis protein BcsD [Mangrovibacter]KEA49920.1 cellulose synthase [Mangrovibacter sp. MFB070]OAT76973.1 cellulose synthase [Mangrovibacter phragmitis]PWW06754.1 cellulose synthase subunit D [Mangrovibacter plantisponsor]